MSGEAPRGPQRAAWPLQARLPHNLLCVALRRFTASKSDSDVAAALAGVNTAAYPNITRYVNHIKSFSAEAAAK